MYRKLKSTKQMQIVNIHNGNNSNEFVKIRQTNFKKNKLFECARF